MSQLRINQILFRRHHMSWSVKNEILLQMKESFHDCISCKFYITRNADEVLTTREQVLRRTISTMNETWPPGQANDWRNTTQVSLVYNAYLGLAGGLVPAFIPSATKKWAATEICKTTNGVQHSWFHSNTMILMSGIHLWGIKWGEYLFCSEGDCYRDRL